MGPVGLGWYLEGFESISEQLVTSLTITSPYSAAMSVPMPMYRPNAMSNETVPVAKTTLVQVTPSLQLPVWSIFLCLYPPLCVACFAVTYLAFRWRWWRAGG